MTCPNCGKQLQRTLVPLYPYKESGLNNVYLKDSVYVHRCECGGKFVEIPIIERLHDAIAYKLLQKKALLTGSEFRFLRKWVGLTSVKLASLLGFKTRITVSKLENEKTPITAATDHMMRLVVLRLKEEAIQQRMNVEIAFEEWFHSIQAKSRTLKITIDQETIENLPFPASRQACTAS